MLTMIVVALVGCSKEQSSFNIEDVPGKATIMGTLSYDAGQGYTNGVHTQLIKGAANVRVVAKVKNESILSSSKGYTIYTTQTDENGNYSLEVPADYDGGVSVQIMADPFFATYSKVVGVENAKPEIESEEVLFTMQDSQEFNVTPNFIKIYDKSYEYDGRSVLKPYQYTSTFIVKVGEGRWSKIRDNDEDKAIQEYKAAVRKDVLVKIGDVYYGATTDSEGKATFIIPSEEKEWTANNAVIEIPGYVVSNYDYYKKEYDNEDRKYVVRKYTIINGTFEQIEQSANIRFSGIEGTPAPISKVRMKFAPFVGEESYGYNWPDKEWEDDTNS